jgi:hypothetical protein
MISILFNLKKPHFSNLFEKLIFINEYIRKVFLAPWHTPLALSVDPEASFDITTEFELLQLHNIFLISCRQYSPLSLTLFSDLPWLCQSFHF